MNAEFNAKAPRRQDAEMQTELVSDAPLALCEAAITVSGERLTPDESKAYMEGFISHAFPVVTSYGLALHAGTIANSYGSLLHQNFNRDHRVAQYYKGTPAEDKVTEDLFIGAVAGVELVNSGSRRLKELLGAPERVPYLRIVNSVFKAARSMDRVLGQYQTGRRPFSLSMEVRYLKSESGFVIYPGENTQTPNPNLNGLNEIIAAETPEDFKEAGFGYVPWGLAPGPLLATYQAEQNAVTKSFAGRRVALLMGGVNGHVHYNGVGLVKYGAEPAAEIGQLLASDPDTAAALERIATGLKNLGRVFQKISHQ
jgi:hypothetical protein